MYSTMCSALVFRVGKDLHAEGQTWTKQLRSKYHTRGDLGRLLPLTRTRIPILRLARLKRFSVSIQGIPRCRKRTCLSSSLDCLLQCELYRLLERQGAAFLPGSVEG